MTDRLIRMGSLAILLKRRLKKPSFWFVLLLGLITLRLVGTAVLPDASNTEVGLMDSGGVYASAITKELLGGRSVYRYRLYTDRSALFDDVASGRLDCGFILDSRLDQAAESGDLTACADAVVSTASTKASAVKEEIFTILLSKYSDQLLSDQCDRGQIFKENTEEAKQALLESSRSLASGDAVLQVFFEDAGTGELTAASSLHEGEAYTENLDSAENQRTARARSRWSCSSGPSRWTGGRVSITSSATRHGNTASAISGRSWTPAPSSPRSWTKGWKTDPCASSAETQGSEIRSDGNTSVCILCRDDRDARSGRVLQNHVADLHRAADRHAAQRPHHIHHAFFRHISGRPDRNRPRPFPATRDRYGRRHDPPRIRHFLPRVFPASRTGVSRNRRHRTVLQRHLDLAAERTIDACQIPLFRTHIRPPPPGSRQSAGPDAPPAASS